MIPQKEEPTAERLAELIIENNKREAYLEHIRNEGRLSLLTELMEWVGKQMIEMNPDVEGEDGAEVEAYNQHFQAVLTHLQSLKKNL